MELKPYGISVTMIEPGDFKTGFTGSRVFAEAANSSSEYAQRCERAITVMAHDEENGADPRQLAQLLVRVIDSAQPALNYRVGLFMQKFLVGLVSFLPDSVTEKILISTYKI